MNLRHFYELSEEYFYLVSPELSHVELERYLRVPKKETGLDNVTEQLFRSLQNKQMYPNIIKFDKNIDQFKYILCDFDCCEIMQKYSEPEKLLDEFTREFHIQKPQNSKTAWGLYATSILSAATFLSRFDDGQKFNAFVDGFAANELSEAALPLLLEKEIFGLGFALACDFLKELGYENYAKPDVHIKDVFKKLKISDGSDYDTFKKVVLIARAANATAYRLDKMLWLICSGNYYLHDIKMNRNREDFVNFCLVHT